mmetsp:Transcript_106472/g.301101  ORF Transcript_106472/g.301101 Transcript_106472/m.301101 type:complete len:204 (-) Transcript_106472:1678-2289(-)
MRPCSTSGTSRPRGTSARPAARARPRPHGMWSPRSWSWPARRAGSRSCSRSWRTCRSRSRPCTRCSRSASGRRTWPWSVRSRSWPASVTSPSRTRPTASSSEALLARPAARKSSSRRRPRRASSSRPTSCWRCWPSAARPGTSRWPGVSSTTCGPRSLPCSPASSASMSRPSTLTRPATPTSAPRPRAPASGRCWTRGSSGSS